MASYPIPAMDGPMLKPLGHFVGTTCMGCFAAHNQKGERPSPATLASPTPHLVPFGSHTTSLSKIHNFAAQWCRNDVPRFIPMRCVLVHLVPACASWRAVHTCSARAVPCTVYVRCRVSLGPLLVITRMIAQLNQSCVVSISFACGIVEGMAFAKASPLPLLHAFTSFACQRYWGLHVKGIREHVLANWNAMVWLCGTTISSHAKSAQGFFHSGLIFKMPQSKYAQDHQHRSPHRHG